MSDPIQLKLQELGIILPQAAVPIAQYRTLIQSGNQIFVSGQLPLENGTLIATGKVGIDLDSRIAKQAAQSCALNILAQVASSGIHLKQIKKIIKITVFVACDPSFTNIAEVANGASDLFVRVFGDAGMHTRSSVGVASLPMNAPVEVEGLLEISQ